MRLSSDPYCVSSHGKGSFVFMAAQNNALGKHILFSFTVTTVTDVKVHKLLLLRPNTIVSCWDYFSFLTGPPVVYSLHNSISFFS